MKLSFEQERNGKLSFLDIEVSRVGNKLVTTVYAYFWWFLYTFWQFFTIHVYI